MLHGTDNCRRSLRGSGAELRTDAYQAPSDRFNLRKFGQDNTGLETTPQLARWLAEQARAQAPESLPELWMADNSPLAAQGTNS